MIFPGKEFHSFASITKRVPVIVCGGLAKRFLVPGIKDKIYNLLLTLGQVGEWDGR